MISCNLDDGGLGVWKSQIPNPKFAKKFQIYKFLETNLDFIFFKLLIFIGIWFLEFGILSVPVSFAAQLPLTYRHQHHIFELESNEQKDWKTHQEVWTHNGKPIKPLAEFRIDGDLIPQLPKGVIRHTVVTWDREAIRRILTERISSRLDREQGTSVIKMTGTGVLFEGIGLSGLKVDLDKAVDLTIQAIENNISDVILPVEEIQPVLNIDKKLQKMGIKEVVSVGESDFSGSPLARKHNIRTGLAKFNGAIIEEGATFSFNKILGTVNRSTGYKEELVILGERTLPDYGGGLCQVSTTAYRGAWEYGFPITERRNHSFAVMYYSPHGTDATIYPPHSDMEFVNDSSGAILIQTYADEQNRAYYIYYGTKDDRNSEIIGPYTWDHQSPPPDRTEYTKDIPPGTTRKAGGRVPGLIAMWYRIVSRGDEEIVEPFYSVYEARPNLTQIGVSDMPGEKPSWIGE